MLHVEKAFQSLKVKYIPSVFKLQISISSTNLPSSLEEARKYTLHGFSSWGSISIQCFDQALEVTFKNRKLKVIYAPPEREA